MRPALSWLVGSWRNAWWLGGLLLVGAVACGDGGSDPGPTIIDYPGNFVGTVSGTDAGTTVEDAPATLTISQSGLTLTGSWTTLGASGTFNGEACSDGSSCYTFVLTQTQPCNGIFSGTGNASSQNNRATRLTGTYTGTYCGGEVQATFALDRQ